MPIARAALVGTRLGLHYALAAAARCANVASSRRFYASFPSPKSKREYVRRLRMPQNRDWYGFNGTLNTTRENVQFLTTNNIAVDNGKAYKLRAPKDDYRLLQEHGVNVAFHESHLLHPYQLEFLNPRGHTTAALTRAELLEQHNTQHLWSIITYLYSTDKAVVRNTAQQRLRASLALGLERAGYDKYGRKEGKGSSIYGTVWLSLQSTMKYVNMPPNEEVGNAIVRMLESEMVSLGRTSPAVPQLSRPENQKDRAGRQWQSAAAHQLSRARNQTTKGGQQRQSNAQRDRHSKGAFADAFKARR